MVTGSLCWTHETRADKLDTTLDYFYARKYLFKDSIDSIRIPHAWAGELIDNCVCYVVKDRWSLDKIV